MIPNRPYDPSFADRVVKFAGEGLFLDEIAVEIGASLADFEAWSIQHPAFAVALADAETATNAWWNRQAREAMAHNRPFRATLWAKVMAQHYGRPGHFPRKPADKPANPAVTVHYDIPDNGRRRRRRKPQASS